MAQHPKCRPAEAFLRRTLSGSEFTWQEIFSLTIPNILDCMSIMFINVLITALISKNGESSMAAVALANPIGSIITCLFQGIGAGGTVIVAQCKGTRNEPMLKRAIGLVLWLTVAVGAASCLPLLLFPRQILMALYPSAEAVVLEKACVYLSGSVWSILVFTVYIAAFSVLRGLGESKKCLVLSVIINVAYLLFSLLFLNGLNMDIQGSVLALLLARIAGAAAAVALLFAIRPPVPMAFREIFSCDRRLLHSTFQVSIPLGLEQICGSLGHLVAQMYMVPLGTTAMATHAIVNSLLGFLYSPASAMCAVSVAVVGRCVGAGKKEEAYTYGKRCNQMSLLLMIAAMVIFYPLLPQLLGTFHPSAESAQLARQLLLWSIPSLLLFWPISNVMPSVLRSASDSVYPSVISLAVLWVINTALGYVLAIPAGLGLWGVWIATWGSWAVRTVFFQIRYRSRKWLNKTTLATANP